MCCREASTLVYRLDQGRSVGSLAVVGFGGAANYVNERTLTWLNVTVWSYGSSPRRCMGGFLIRPDVSTHPGKCLGGWCHLRYFCWSLSGRLAVPMCKRDAGGIDGGGDLAFPARW